jgi:outer membrane lipopolysaccharide assembly protein LptE/RlpB
MISRVFACFFFLSLVAPALLLTQGCGYHLGEVRPTTMRSVRNVAVPTFKNRTYRPRVEVLLANSLIRQLHVDGTYSVVGTERADAIIYGTLQDARRIPIRSAVSNVLRTTEYRLTLDINYEVQDRITGAILMQGTVSGSTTFFPTGDLVTDERQAFSVAAERAMENLARRISTGW